MAISSERFVGTKHRNWLSSVHGISTVPTFKCSIIGTVNQGTLIESGAPVILHADGSADVVVKGGTVPAFVAGDQLGFLISDRLPDVVGGDEPNEELGLNAATLMHGRIRYSFLPDEAKAAVDAATVPGEGVAPAFGFTVHRQ